MVKLYVDLNNYQNFIVYFKPLWMWWFSGIVILAGTGDLLEALNVPLPEVGDQPQQEMADSGQ